MNPSELHKLSRTAREAVQAQISGKPKRQDDPGSTISTKVDQRDLPSYVIVLSLPPEALHPNCRANRWDKAKATKTARDAAHATALLQTGTRRPRWKSATVKLVFYFATPRRRDQQNMIAWTKAPIDGLQDADIIEDDSGLTFLPVEVLIDTETPRLQIIITKMER